MPIQRAEAQTSTLAKLAPPHTTAHKLGHELLDFRSCTSPLTKLSHQLQSS
jgi:hypothetical protein